MTTPREVRTAYDEREGFDSGDRHLAPGADPDCKFCHGEGFVTDWVDYGSTTVPMQTACECMPDDE